MMNNDENTLVLPAALAPYVNSIMIRTPDPVDISLTDYGDWTQIEEGTQYSYLYRYVYYINTGTELWALGSMRKLYFVTE